MNLFYKKNVLEVGIDEVARGCLLGRVYTAAVIWNSELDDTIDHPIMKDSKKFSRKKRLLMEEYIKNYALDYSISYCDEKTIDEINILNSTFKSMHQSLNNLNIDFDHILVDGKLFKPYYNSNDEIISHLCIEKGDEKYYSIAAASILAKVEHDRYIQDLCHKYPDLDNKYDLLSNMGYGTAKHIDGIKKYGTSPFHRKTFGICKDYAYTLKGLKC